ncbi:hypothetical protein [Pseudooceanicola atlanticus]|uniref:hypothetical protein n=1 Tax=Pseudooceanicola atlanticus TaxID=1461694 RepID=UPI002355FB14|nr:hypothetical protein [Pseudooceanicola atlanticus]
MPEHSRSRTPFDQLPVAQQAGILCNDQRFQRYAAEQSDLTGISFGPSAAAEFLRKHCKIASRRDLNTDPEARQRFKSLTTEFEAWTGKIACPRR